MLTETEAAMSHWVLEGTELLHNDCPRTDVLRGSNDTQRRTASGIQFKNFWVSVLADQVKTKARGTKGMLWYLTLEVTWTSKGSCLMFPITSRVVFGQTSGTSVLSQQKEAKPYSRFTRDSIWLMARINFILNSFHPFAVVFVFPKIELRP